MKRFNKNTAILLLLLLGLSGCHIQGKKTSMRVEDPERHYYPILQGQILDLVFPIINEGEFPLIIDEVQSSCGCVLVDQSAHQVIPAGGKGFLRLQYNSAKNIGYVKHYINFYGNMLPQGSAQISFDLNVVPDAHYTKDYEELDMDHRKRSGIVKELVDGDHSERGYYVGEP